jgi:hypothetical protein
MATRGAIAVRDAEARDRMRLVQARLAKRLGFEQPEPAELLSRNPDYRAMQEVEGFAAFLEAVDGALKDEGYSAAAGKEGKPVATQDEGGDPASPVEEVAQDAAAKGVTLDVAVDEHNEPVVVTESVAKKGAKK